MIRDVFSIFVIFSFLLNFYEFMMIILNEKPISEPLIQLTHDNDLLIILWIIMLICQFLCVYNLVLLKNTCWYNLWKIKYYVFTLISQHFLENKISILIVSFVGQLVNFNI